MDLFNETASEEIQNTLFDIQAEPQQKSAWWWWFWLYFFNNPENPQKPRQLMILWSTKFDPQISCNDLEMTLNHKIGQESGMKDFDGAVASWFYDGSKMHHNYLLEHCTLKNTGNQLSSDSTPKTTFTGKTDKYTVKIGERMKFIASLKEKNAFTIPEYHENEFMKKRFNYKIMRMNKLALSGHIWGEPIKGTAYFQRLFVNAPAVPWYWGIFHFDNGSILTYFKPNLGKYFGQKSIKKDITFYHDGQVHRFKDIKVRKMGHTYPLFYVHGENANESISFVVSSYASSQWQFKKKLLNVGPKSTFTYHEYPAKIKWFELTNKKTGDKIRNKDTGLGVGNAEHSTGFLL